MEGKLKIGLDQICPKLCVCSWESCKVRMYKQRDHEKSDRKELINDNQNILLEVSKRFAKYARENINIDLDYS